MKRRNGIISALCVVLALSGCWSTRNLTAPTGNPPGGPSPNPSPTPTTNPNTPTTISAENNKILLKDLKVEALVDVSGRSPQGLLNEINAGTAKVVPVGLFDGAAGWSSPPSDQSLWGTVSGNTIQVSVPASTNQPGGVGKLGLAVVAQENGTWKIVGWIYWQGIANGKDYYYSDGAGYKMEIKDRNLIKR